MKNLVLILVLFAVWCGSAMAQQDSVVVPVAEEPPGFKPYVFWGGTAYLSFGSTTTIGASPLVGVYLTPKFAVGGGLTYIYSKSDDFTWHTYGGRVVSRYHIVPQLFAKAEFHYLYYNAYFKGNKIDSYGVPYLFLGAGYRQQVGPRTYLDFEVMFDVLQNEKSQYDSWTPVIGIGVAVGV